MTRKNAIIYIKSEVAKYGTVTAQATRYYIEARMSRATFNKTVDIGMAIYSKNQTSKAQQEVNHASEKSV